MNRSLLLIICDFLLLSLLALARFDEPNVEQAPVQQVDPVASQAAVDQDLIEILKMSLEAEQIDRNQVDEHLDEARKQLLEKNKQLLDREERLRKNEQEALQAEAQLSEEVERVREQLASVDQERRQAVESMSQLRHTAEASQERILLMQQQMQHKQAEIAALSKRAQALESEKRVVEFEKQALQSRVAIAETESLVMEATLKTARADIDYARLEKQQLQNTTEKLADGLGDLAANTEKIEEVVKAMKPLSLNTLFEKFLNNHVRITFNTEEELLIGTQKDTYVQETLLASDGERLYAILHINDTPFRTSGLLSVDGILEMSGKRYLIQQVQFLKSDPRLVIISVPNILANAGGIENFQLSADPLRFSEAVVIDGQREYYGQSPFKLDLNDPHYLRMKTDLFNRLFGEFSPQRGDLLIAENGNFLGMMVNREYSRVVSTFESDHLLDLGKGFSKDKAAAIKDWVDREVEAMPVDLR